MTAAAVLIDLLPLIVGAAVLPIWVIVSLLLLRGEGGVFKAAAFAGGAMTVRLVQGVLFGYVFGAAADASGEGASRFIASTLLLVVGILLLITAARSWRAEDDPDAPPPAWMSTLGAFSALKSFGIGALMMTIAVKQGAFTLSAIAVIDEAPLVRTGSVLAYLLFVVAAHSLVLAPIVASAAAPARSAAGLEAVRGWLERSNRVITLAVSSIFGAWFVWKGVTKLLG
jgi:hypothetical protein